MTKIKLKELLGIAKAELNDLTTLQNPDFRLEQATYNSADSVWEIIVSYLVENTNKPTKIFAGLAPEFQFYRIYKKLTINNNREVQGLFIYSKDE